MNREDAAKKYGNCTINGINCGTIKDTAFMPTACNERLINQSPLIHALVEKYPNFSVALQGVDRNYDALSDRKITTNPLQKDADNKAKLVGKLSHHIKLNGRTPSKLLESYGDIGIVPSEYFGILESEREACFCVSLARLYERNRNEDPIRVIRCQLKSNGMIARVLHTDTPNENVFFLLDDQISADIENNNFFALKEYPDDSKETIDAKQAKFDALPPDQQLLYSAINAVSHGVSTYEESEWFAFPGGIPSKYINGIVMDSRLMETDPNLSSTLDKHFPQATIINIQDNSIVRDPILTQEQAQ